MGISIGPDLRPTGARGEVLYENLYAAGSVIGGYDPTAERCGPGVDIVTGYLAGRNAAAYAASRGKGG